MWNVRLSAHLHPPSTWDFWCPQEALKQHQGYTASSLANCTVMFLRFQGVWLESWQLSCSRRCISREQGSNSTLSFACVLLSLWKMQHPSILFAPRVRQRGFKLASNIAHCYVRWHLPRCKEWVSHSPLDHANKHEPVICLSRITIRLNCPLFAWDEWLW